MPWPKGRPRSPGTRAKVRAALLGRPRPPEVRAKIAATKTGQRPTIQTRVKLQRIAMEDGRVVRMLRARGLVP